jgi:hypothetical protein
MAFDSCDLVRSGCYCAFRRRVVRHKNQENLRAWSNAEFISKTPEEESDTHANANCFAKIKESFADSVPDAEEQIKAQESVSHSNTGGIASGNRDSVRESGGITRSGSRKKGLA